MLRVRRRRRRARAPRLGRRATPPPAAAASSAASSASASTAAASSASPPPPPPRRSSRAPPRPQHLSQPLEHPRASRHLLQLGAPPAQRVAFRSHRQLRRRHFLINPPSAARRPPRLPFALASSGRGRRRRHSFELRLGAGVLPDNASAAAPATHAAAASKSSPSIVDESAATADRSPRTAAPPAARRHRRDLAGVACCASAAVHISATAAPSAAAPTCASPRCAATLAFVSSSACPSNAPGVSRRAARAGGAGGSLVGGAWRAVRTAERPRRAVELHEGGARRAWTEVGGGRPQLGQQILAASTSLARRPLSPNRSRHRVEAISARRASSQRIASRRWRSRPRGKGGERP